ncbi:MAG TPA: tRNA (adenosine(37)-N6)-threonylcarbamoyltransferase complex ATPase subunit type 1 TsaE [Elusimicrobiota bacterium]|nr:tRNA (adenosine(37)-N6)-threonylcarbamoyltransferase complex ATPase subunit type 1 TsaE [Elusimicrobiota bacterium]
MKTTLPDEKATLDAAARVGRALRPGDVVCLEGPLGAGKTTFVRGMLRGLRYRGEVTSPTFALVNEYRMKALRVCHVDLYRIEAGEVCGLGLEDYLADPRTACVIEWPAAAEGVLPRDRLGVSLGYLGEGGSKGRRASLRASGPASRALLRRSGL